MKKVLLTGYMASGKTTIALLLSKAAGITYIDLDEIIEERAGKSIADIFEQHGEIQFRRLEHEALKSAIDNKESFILSLGGGTPCYANNHEFLKVEDVISVYLRASVPVLAKRLREHDHRRPVLDNVKPGELEDFIAKHLFDRSYFYHQAKHVVNVDNKSPEDIVNEIMSLF
jgi:shikimate kinase